MQKLVPLVLVALFVSACGGSSDVTTPTTTAPAPAPAPTTTAPAPAPTTTAPAPAPTTAAPAPTTTAPTTTAPAAPATTVSWESVTGWDCASTKTFPVSRRYQDSLLELEFGISPTAIGFTAVSVQTVPSQSPNFWSWDGNATNGFNEVNVRRIGLTNLSSTSSSVEMASPTPTRVNVAVSLVAEHSDGSVCELSIFPDFTYESGVALSGQVTIPAGVVVNNSRYASFTLPEPTAEALIYSISQDDPYGENGARNTRDELISDFPAKFRTALYGDPGLTHWEIVAELIEILRVVAPDLDARFASTHEEVTFPIHVTSCATWKRESDLSSCNSRGMGGFASNGPIESGVMTSAESRGYIWLDQSPDGCPWCSLTTLRHEIGHGVGLPHVNCPGSMMIVPDNQGMYWSASDLAGIAVHQDPRTIDKMTLDEARAALGIPEDSRWNELVADRSLACSNPTASFDDLAASLANNSWTPR